MCDNIIQLNRVLIHNELKDLVRTSAEKTFNALLDHKADELFNAENASVPVNVKDIIPHALLIILNITLRRSRLSGVARATNPD